LYRIAVSAGPFFSGHLFCKAIETFIFGLYLHPISAGAMLETTSVLQGYPSSTFFREKQQ